MMNEVVQGLLWTSPNLLLPREPPLQVTVGNKSIDFLVDRYRSYILSVEHKINQEKLGYSNDYWSDWTVTKTGTTSTSRMPVWGSKAYA